MPRKNPVSTALVVLTAPRSAKRARNSSVAPSVATRVPAARSAGDDFSDALYGQTKNAPWVASSLALHALAFGIFLLFPGQAPRAVPDVAVVTMAPMEEPLAELREEEPLVVDPVDKIFEESHKVVSDEFVPTPENTEPGREDEEGDDKLIGDPNAFGSTAFEARWNDAALGLGATSPGRFGHRGKGKGGDGGGGIGGRAAPTNDDQIDLALDWLARHQSPDGRWDGDGYDALCKGTRCSGVGEPTHDAGLTGLAMLCFLGHGHTHQMGPYKDVMRNGLKYLRSVQDAEGSIGPRTSQQFQYDHAIATLALCEAYGMSGAANLKGMAQQAVDFIHRSRNPYVAWRYGVRDGDNDTSVTGWAVMALKSAKMADLVVDPGAFTGALEWVEKMTEPEFGRVGYQTRGGLPARTTAMVARFPADQSESMTAVGVLTRIFSGQDPAKEPSIKKGLELMGRRLPKWDIDAGTIDMYYWYYGTLAAFQAGGENWRAWNQAMKPAILDTQRKEPNLCVRGSWDPEDCWATEGGRVYSTTLMCLCLEVYERYPRVFGTK